MLWRGEHQELLQAFEVVRHMGLAVRFQSGLCLTDEYRIQRPA